MDPDLWRQLVMILILIILNAFFAASEIAMVSLRKTRIRQLVDDGNKAAIIVDRLLKDPSRFLATIQIGITLAGFLASAAAAVSLSDNLAGFLATIPLPFIAQASQVIAVFLVTLLISYVTLVIGELAPKRLALQKAERIALFSAKPIELLARAAYPFTRLLTVSTNVVMRLIGGTVHHQEQEITEEELRLMVAQQISLEEEEKQMIDGIFEFGDSIARGIMTPRIDIFGVENGRSVGETVSLMARTGFSRLPVYRESIDQITGLVYLKDLLPLQLEGKEEEQINLHTRPVSFVPEWKSLPELLKEMRKNYQHMVIVSDEYGGTAGLVTIEDLLEEIVGEIRDEDDVEQDPVQIVGEEEYLVDAMLCVEEANAALNTSLPVEDAYETVGGLVLKELGQIPSQGDYLVLSGILLIVERMKGNRIVQLRVKRELARTTITAS